jgi:hypothetical protein
MLSAAKALKLRLPAAREGDTRIKYLTTFNKFGKHVDIPTRRAYELIQNSMDQWRKQASIENDTAATLRVSIMLHILFVASETRRCGVVGCQGRARL